tara:strand:- start:152 stop:283 length:132 start_codon:yes stop_codon:yes gene_type:complete
MDPNPEEKINENGKGSHYRILVTDKQYQENYKKVFRKNRKKDE